jgi:bacteriorhodopsin
MSIVYRSAVWSLSAQLILGAFTTVGLFIVVPKEKTHNDLLPIFALELSSQVVEFAWYCVVVCKYREITTWTRYIDWFLSTPVMLLSAVLFFLHRSGTSYDVFWHSGRLYVIVMFNWLMLSFGFAMELSTIPRLVGLSFGIAMLIASFSVMASFLHGDQLSNGLFVFMFLVWVLYGVAAAFPYTEKNVAYNALDVVSKNFYGVFLTVYSIVL